ncbi:MAG: sensor histidine kinase [Chloroflexota bacterium]
MLVVELRPFLFFCLVLVVAALWLVPPLAGWLHRRRLAASPTAGLGPALERAPLGVLVLGEGPALQFANHYARQTLALPPHQHTLPQSAWTDLLAQDRLEARTAGEASGRYRSLTLPGGEGSLAARWWVVPQASGRDVVFLLDITAQGQAEAAARNLLNDVSHELRTPLATILTHLEVLGLPNLPVATSAQSLRLLKAEAKRMARLVQLMLELGRLEAGAEVERRPVDLVALAEEALGQLRPQAAERGIALSLAAEADLPRCLGDADRLRQVFLNLLDNAVKYCRPGDQASASLRRAGELIECVVEDSGPGIPAAQLPHVTRRFYRAAPQASDGSGLGLALVAEIVRRHGAELHIESESEGEATGTRVAFALPPATREVGVTAALPAPRVAAQ